ncbi:hypothetical protein vBKpPFBKp16_008 [Klebsiella phage vB_KpP_FBKp16]|uniref:Uncharacterized protein n=1 Tax=Klebsiella phage vB_KpP_FBKp16 TaxID=2801836 RepID=A0A7U0GAQ2_9CAUD|nr:hypothetical protein vBKpPFBKp16_008 [Klebsiella phage vB_KpP_FBKp16]
MYLCMPLVVNSYLMLFHKYLSLRAGMRLMLPSGDDLTLRLNRNQEQPQGFNILAFLTTRLIFTGNLHAYGTYINHV